MVICLQPGTSMERVISRGDLIDASVTGVDLGFRPRGLKWKGKAAITTTELQKQARKKK